MMGNVWDLAERVTPRQIGKVWPVKRDPDRMPYWAWLLIGVAIVVEAFCVFVLPWALS